MIQQQAPPSARGSLLWVLLFLFLIWTIHTFRWQTGTDLAHWGVFPQKLEGLTGIFTMPLVHKDLDHIWNNSFGLLVTGWILLYAYPNAGKQTLVFCWLFTGLGVWIIGRPAYHIGASGMVYSLTSFIFFSGIIRRDKSAVGYALIVSFFFGASFWGIFPFQKGVSWEGHLMGAITGCLSAIFWRNRNRPPKDPDSGSKFVEPSNWPVSEIPYLEGTQLEQDDPKHSMLASRFQYLTR